MEWMGRGGTLLHVLWGDTCRHREIPEVALFWAETGADPLTFRTIIPRSTHHSRNVLSPEKMVAVVYRFEQCNIPFEMVYR